MTETLLDSSLDVTIRITMILGARPNIPRTAHALAAIDLINTHQGDYFTGRPNLHGHMRVAASLARQCELIGQALPFAVRQGLIQPINGGEFLTYGITSSGKEFERKLSSNYARNYRNCLITTLAFIDSRDGSESLRLMRTPTGQEG